MDPARNEDLRLHALMQLNLLDTPPSESFDRITRMASRMFNLPIAAVSLTDRDRQWFKSRVGVEHWEIPREKAPCGEVADTAGPLVVKDLLQSPCYRDSLLAQSGIRFYAAAPLVTREGFSLGAMCVLGTEPRDISPEEESVLADLAAMVMAQIELQHAFGRIEPVSGLPNRHQLLDDLEDEARDHPGGSRCFVLLELADAARLQEASRVLGPGTVDELVRETVAALRLEFGPSLKIYQVGIAQLGWVVPPTGDEALDQDFSVAAAQLADYLRGDPFSALAKPVAGIAPFRLGGVAAEDLLRIAHGAALDARHADQLVSAYSEEADNRHRRRFRLVGDMGRALLADDQLSLVYQPRVDLRTGRCVGAEALLRWTHPDLGFVSPGEFIPIVERTDLAHPLTDWVIGAAIRQAIEWKRIGIVVPIAVNVSAANLEKQDFGSRLIERIAAAGLPTTALEIEVTESAIIRDGTRVGEQLRDLRRAGIKVAIDDFGTGYSSLSYLQNLPADIIKIDQSFVRNLKGDDRSRTLVQSMISMAKGLGFSVVAEGIEDETAYEFLRDSSCDEGQGYLMSRPYRPRRWCPGWRAAGKDPAKTRLEKLLRDWPRAAHSGPHGYGGDLDLHVPRQARHFDRCARGRGALEVAGVDLVHLAEFVEVLQENGRGHDAVHRQPVGLKDRFQIVEHEAGLVLDAGVFHQLLRLGVDGNLARQKHHVPGPNRLGIRADGFWRVRGRDDLLGTRARGLSECSPRRRESEHEEHKP
jgi:EAL domain-containing protein (putative c-di-GMP-specific phosphodiesterase class I)/GAF domain-containing protein